MKQKVDVDRSVEVLASGDDSFLPDDQQDPASLPIDAQGDITRWDLLFTR